MARLLCYPFSLLRFIIDPSNIADLLACAPYWIALLSGEAGGSGLSFVRAIRLMRVFRIFKASRYTTGLKLFTGALRASTESLQLLLMILLLAMIIVSSMMYLIEGSFTYGPNATEYDRDLLSRAGVSGETQKFCFGTIPSAFWWAIVTMTTVGYGDCYPITLSGKLVCTGACSRIQEASEPPPWYMTLRSRMG